MKLLKTIGYLGAGLALFACGESHEFNAQIDELALGQAEYAVQRACLSEDAQLFKSCTSKDGSDKACKARLKKVRDTCAVEARPVGQTEEEEYEARPVREARAEADARPVREVRDDEEARPVREGRDDEEARPVREGRDEAEAQPVREARDEAEARPVREGRDDEEARPVREGRDDEEARPERPEPQDESRPEGPENCQSECRAHAHETFLDCVETGRDERRCRDYAADHMQACIVDRCEDPQQEPVRPRPEPATCEDKCRSFGHAAFDRCVESGRRPVMCRSYAGRLIQSCIETRCTDEVEPEPRPEPSNCAVRARAAHTQCLETGRDETVCIERAHRVHAACVTAESQDTESDAADDANDSNAPTACQRRSRALFAQCLDNGGSRLRCQALAHRFLDRCNSVQSDETIDETTEAEDADAEVNRACAQRAQAVHAQCQRDTGGSDRCDTVARGAYQACTEMTEDSNAQRSEPNHDANRACGERARQLYANCIDDEGEAERCGAMAHRAAERCESANARD